MLKVGEVYKTKGGWDVKIIWKSYYQSNYYAIHKPNTKEESPPILHDINGKAITSFSVNEAPSYGNHPADIIIK